MNCWSQLPGFAEFGDGVEEHDLLEEDAVVAVAVVVAVVDGNSKEGHLPTAYSKGVGVEIQLPCGQQVLGPPALSLQDQHPFQVESANVHPWLQ